MNNLIKKMTYKLTVLFLTGIILTIIAFMSYYTHGSSKEFPISSSDYKIYAVSDFENGGNSSAEIFIHPDGSFGMNCLLVEGFKKNNPYCSIVIVLNHNYKEGIPVNEYEEILVNIEFTGSGKAIHSPLVYLRNYNEDYSKEDPFKTMKFNIAQLHGYISGEDLSIPLSNFFPADWWIERFNIPVSQGGSEINNVSVVQIATGPKAVMGRHIIKINKLIIKGHYLSEQMFLIIIVSFWMLLSMITICMFYSKLFEERKLLKKHNKSLEKMNQDIKDESNKDALTSAYNRYAIKNLIEQKNSIFYSTSHFSVIYIDIDFFKKVNDKYGHSSGDEVLIDFSSLIFDNIRHSDYFSRWGGEEFIIFCPNTTLKSAKYFADTLRHKICKHRFKHGERVTCSFGVAEVGKEPIHAAIDRADKALYEAKQTGRNKVVAKEKP